MALPGVIPVTKPELLIVAMAALEEVHVPPGLDADSTVDSPTHILLSPLTTDPSCWFTSMVSVTDEQPVVSDTKVKAASPGEMPVTKPELVTEAMAGCELVQLPPSVGYSVDDPPKQSEVSPVMATTGRFNTCTGSEALDAQPLEEEVNIKVEDPGESPVTSPSLLIAAMAPLVESQEPPVVGVRVVVL